MKWAELVIVGIVHACAALLALAVMTSLKLDEHLDIAPVVAAIAATQAAGWLYHRRDHETAPMGPRLIVGALLAVLCLAEASCFRAAGIISGTSGIEITVATTTGSFVMALALFGTMRRAFERSPSPAPRPLSRRTTAMVILPLLVIASVCAILLFRRADVTLTVYQLPGISIALPNWKVLQTGQDFGYGKHILEDPAGRSRFISLQWTVTDEMEPEFFEQAFATGGVTVRDRQTITVGGHAAHLLYMESAAGDKRTVATSWYCHDDRRQGYLLTFLDLPKARLMAFHRQILASIQCHTGTRGSNAPLPLPVFDPPPGFVRFESPPAIGYSGPGERIIMILPGISEWQLPAEGAATEIVAGIVRTLPGMSGVQVTATPALFPDPAGDRRQFCSATATGDRGQKIGFEIMMWSCVAQKRMFLSFYADPNPYDVQHVRQMLLAAKPPPPSAGK